MKKTVALMTSAVMVFGLAAGMLTPQMAAAQGSADHVRHAAKHRHHPRHRSHHRRHGSPRSASR